MYKNGLFFPPRQKKRYRDDAKVITQHDKRSYVRYLLFFILSLIKYLIS